MPRPVYMKMHSRRCFRKELCVTEHGHDVVSVYERAKWDKDIIGKKEQSVM